MLCQADQAHRKLDFREYGPPQSNYKFKITLPITISQDSGYSDVAAAQSRYSDPRMQSHLVGSTPQLGLYIFMT